MAESDFTYEVTTLAAAKGLLVHWCTDSRKCDGQRGFPDVFIAGPRGILLAELKERDLGETSADQDLWLWMLHEVDTLCGRECERCGPLSVVWTRADLDSGTIERTLSDLAGLHLRITASPFVQFAALDPGQPVGQLAVHGGAALVAFLDVGPDRRVVLVFPLD